MANAVLEQIRQITDRPVRYVINTNSQPHRILGNATFRKEGAEVIAAAEAAPRIAGEGAAIRRRISKANGLRHAECLSLTHC